MKQPETRKNEIDSTLEAILTEQSPQRRGPLDKFSSAIRYALLPGGKRLRPTLVLAACEAVNGNTKAALTVGVAIEMIHTYSLIHDDLPSMDDSPNRRGKPSLHTEFDEGTAILTGDALLTDAFALLAELPARHKLSPEKTLNIISTLAKSSGSTGMVAGQILDIQSPSNISFPELEFLAIHKTGKLIRASVLAGAMTGDPTKEELEALAKYGEQLGLAFQIVDDLNDSSEAMEQRTPEIPRPSFVQTLGVDESKERASELIKRAIGNLDLFGKKGEELGAIAKRLLDSIK